MKNSEFVSFVRKIFNTNDFIPLHSPKFNGNEKKYILDAIDSTFVSSVGQYVDKFESNISEITGSKYGIATVNGTSALHICLIIAGVEQENEVLTQPLTFVATANAIRYCGATPIFIDVNKETLGMDPDKLEEFLFNYAEIRNDGICYNKISGKKIAACVPMHTFGFCNKIEAIQNVCDKWNIFLIEDAAESLGSFVREKHTGNFGKLSAISFNGNKIITAGGGGVILTNDEKLAKKAKHLTTTAKIPHKWEYVHDEIGYNYRMPNLNAALICAQLEQLNTFIYKKRELALSYKRFFLNQGVQFYFETEGTTANYWLNTILLKNIDERNAFLDYTNSASVMTRPSWELMCNLKMFKNNQTGNLDNSIWLSERLVNIPSSVI
jgi:perosamine synthetase